MEILGGPLFGVAGAGESHGPAITTIVFGCPPGLKISRQWVQKYLDRRRPGSNKYGTTRQEGDQVAFLSGLYAEGEYELLLSGPDIRLQIEGEKYQTETYKDGYTTGEPIAAVVLSTSKISRHYEQFAGPAGEVRPGHTGLVKHYKSKGFVDVRGGGRSSYRSTISDVIGGSIARIFLKEHFNTVILSSICQVGPLKTSLSLADHFEQLIQRSQNQKVSQEEISQVEETLADAEIHSLDTRFALEAAELIKEAHDQGDSLGATVEVVALNVPSLVGEPLYQSLKQRLMGILGGLNAAQFCEVGGGADVVARRGSENNDPIRRSGYQANSHGGMIGGITTGMPLVCRVGFKPTSTINKPQLSVCKNMKEIDFIAEKGRHDPCVGVRAGVTLESRMAIELMNAVLMHQSHQLNTEHFKLF
ncbi:MAG: chorismate synthase [Candidatus Electrothrix sp. AR1]|nr:chorismate synthase [Candidatus Electrothrix sp. AR1]